MSDVTDPEVDIHDLGDHDGIIHVGGHNPLHVGFYAKEQPMYSGWVEPQDNSWILFLDKDEKPSLYFPQRNESGEVIGNGQQLDQDDEEVDE